MPGFRRPPDVLAPETHMHVQVRTVTGESAGLLAELHELCLESGHDAPTRSWTAQEFADLLRAPSCRAFVANERSHQQAGMEMPVGFAIVTFAGEEGDLLFIGVVPARLRRGIGLAVLDRILEVARMQGVRSMILEVADGNEAAQSLYRRRGFLEAARRRDYYRAADGRTQDAIVMKLNL